MRVYVGNNEKIKNYDLILVPGKNLFTGVKAFEEQFGKASSLEVDTLNLAAAVYATDLAVKRNDLEKYIRSIYLTIDVINYHAFDRIKVLLSNALYILTCDNWEIEFKHVKGNPENKTSFEEKKGVVLLFSGGLDSLCGATYYSSKNISLRLVSHINNNRTTSGAQEKLFEAIKNHYPSNEIKRIEYRVNGRKHRGLSFPEEREDSQRTRSFLFLSLAALTARRIGYNKIISISENGQFAIHLPLSPARVGPFSTHTADPAFINTAQELFKILLELNYLSIENPFLYYTKAEVLNDLPKELYPIIIESVSCWKASRIDKNHCGECIPCFTRRIAIESHGIKLPEFVNDLFNQKIEDLPPDHEGKRNLGDFLSFIITYNKIYETNKAELLYEFPELINDAFDYNQATEMYYRMTKQAISVLATYPNIKKLLK